MLFLRDASCHFFVRLRCHFIVELVCPGVSLGDHVRPRGLPKGAKSEKLVRGSFVGPPLGQPLEPKSATNRKRDCCKNRIEAYCAQIAAEEISGDALKPKKH